VGANMTETEPSGQTTLLTMERGDSDKTGVRR
jgi:hypothetical protein